MQLQDDDASPGAQEELGKNTAEMILAEKDQVDMKLRKEDGHKPVEIGTKEAAVYACGQSMEVFEFGILISGLLRFALVRID